MRWLLLPLFTLALLIPAFQSIPANQGLPAPVVYDAPHLEIAVSPMSGSAPLDLGVTIVDAYHPWGVEYVQVSLAWVVSENGRHPFRSPQDVTAEGYDGKPWYAEFYIDEAPYLYELVACIRSGPAPDGVDRWEFAPGGNDCVTMILDFTAAAPELPEPRPIQNEGYQQPYEEFIWTADPNRPYCLYSVNPTSGPVPLTVDVSMGGSTPAGAPVLMYYTTIVGTDFLVQGKLRPEISTYAFDDEYDTGQAKFADPTYKLSIDKHAHYVSESSDSVFRYDFKEHGGYVMTLATQAAGQIGSKRWTEYINVLGPGNEAPVAVLTSWPEKVELEEITLLQKIVDEGADPTKITGHELDMVRVPPRGAIPVKLDATGSFDPDGSIVNYLWYIYGERVFQHSTGRTPELTFYVDSAEWPSTSINVGVLVVDNQGFTAQQHLTIFVEQQLPFGVRVDVVESDENADDSLYGPETPVG